MNQSQESQVQNKKRELCGFARLIDVVKSFFLYLFVVQLKA